MADRDRIETGIHATVPWHQVRAPELRDCRHPWDRIDVTNTGEALACCFTQETLGNVLADGFDAILSGDRRRRLQEDVRRNRVNPGCFNAPCMFAHMSIRRPWTVEFPADRFTSRHSRIGGDIAYDPTIGDDLLAEGPGRYLPSATIKATLNFSLPEATLFNWKAGDLSPANTSRFG